MNYQVLRHTNAEELEKQVRRALGNGWQLQGGVSICTKVDNDIFFAQAIVKEQVSSHI